MSENDKPPNGGSPPNPPPQPPQLPELPSLYSIPVQLLEQWTKIAPGEYLNLQVTRHDLDMLFFGMMMSYNAQVAANECLVEWSNGRLESANAKLAESRRCIIEGQNHVRQFFTALMASATSQRKSHD